MYQNANDEIQEPTPDDIPSSLPLIPLRDVVIFPFMIFPILVGRDSSISAVTAAIEKDKFISSQRSAVPRMRIRASRNSSTTAPWPAFCKCSNCPTG